MSRIADLEKMLDDQPDDPFLIYALAREYEQVQNTMQAVLMYEHLVNQHPDYIATYYHYAKLLYTAGNHNGGIQLLEKGITFGQKNNDAHAVSEMKGMLMMWKNEDEDED